MNDSAKCQKCGTEFQTGPTNSHRCPICGFAWRETTYCAKCGDRPAVREYRNPAGELTACLCDGCAKSRATELIERAGSSRGILAG